MLDKTNALVRRVLQAVSDLPPWACTYVERPDDLLEVRVSELETILQVELREALGASTGAMESKAETTTDEKVET